MTDERTEKEMILLGLAARLRQITDSETIKKLQFEVNKTTTEVPTPQGNRVISNGCETLPLTICHNMV